MNILVAGATGALGSQLVPMLVEAGHRVWGTTRHPSNHVAIDRMGATALTMDALDSDSVIRAVSSAEPEAIVHQLSGLSGKLNFRKLDSALASTNRLRTTGTDNLLAAARAAGTMRFVAQSYAGSGLPFAREGSLVKTEEDPMDPSPIAGMRETIAALRYHESAVTGADWIEGIALRYGTFYGPGTSIIAGGEYFEAVRKRQMPLVGDAGGVWSFIHVEDAAEATVMAITHGRRGVYQIVDDDPAAVAEWLPVVVRATGARPPFRIPRWLGRILGGETIAVMMTEVRGASNAKAKRELGWTPRRSSWRTGFVEVAGTAVAGNRPLAGAGGSAVG